MSKTLSLNEVMAELSANKVRRHNHLGATRRLNIGRRDKFSSRHLGKLQGYCKNCGLMIAEEDFQIKDADVMCPKCGSHLKVEELRKIGPKCKAAQYEHRCIMDWC